MTEIEKTLYESQEKLSESQIRRILVLPPRKEWVDKIEELNGYRYLPIDKVEWLLFRLFENWNLDITHIISSDKKCIVGVSISYKVGRSAYKKAGVGSCDIGSQFTSASTAFPAAKSIAIRDAAEMIGNVFGANLNRKNVPVPEKEKPVVTIHEKVLEFTSKLKYCATDEALVNLFKEYEKYAKEPYFGQIKALYLSKRDSFDLPF